MTLEHYCKLFSKLNRAPGPAWDETTRNRAPHKPLLLLAVMDLVARGVITSRRISITGELVELNELFTDYWRSVVPLARTSSIAFPFPRLDREPFWTLLPLPGREITGAVINSIDSVTKLRRVALGAEMDEALFRHMTTEAGRKALTAALLQSCFSPAAQLALGEQGALHGEAFRYSRVLEEAAHALPAAEKVFPGDYRAAARNQGFRRAIVLHYDHRCAFCGTRIVTAEGHTVVDAAHIVPWSVSQNDDIRNGMALCKLCHWSFDKGLVGVSEEYAVIVSRQLGLSHNVPGVLLALSDREIRGPEDRALWPDQGHLGWHRRAFRL